METVKLIIDRKPVEVSKGTTILDAAKGMGIRIPTLCYMKLEDLHYENNPGACRICVVAFQNNGVLLGRRNLIRAKVLQQSLEVTLRAVGRWLQIVDLFLCHHLPSFQNFSSSVLSLRRVREVV